MYHPCHWIFFPHFLWKFKIRHHKSIVYILFAGNLHFLSMLQKEMVLCCCFLPLRFGEVKLFSHFIVVYRASMHVI